MLNKKVIAGFIISAVLITNVGYASEGIKSTSAKPATVKKVSTSVKDKNYITVADAALCKAKIIKLNKENGRFDILVKSIGNGEGEIVFHINEDTKINVNRDKLAVGNNVDIFYSGALTRSLPPQGNAIAVNVVEEEANRYVGEVKEIISVKSGKMLSVVTKDKNANFDEIIFNISKDTKFKRGTMKNIKKGTKVIVEYGNVMTLSLPPHTNALSVELEK